MDLDPGGSRLVFVLDVDEDSGAASVCMTSNEIELASDTDVFVDGAVTGLPFPLLVETDVVGPVWFAQLGPVVGSLVETDLAAAVAAPDPEWGQIPAELRGLPIRDRSDSRWQWKEAELAALHTLSADCAATISGDDPAEVLLVDPALRGAGEGKDAWQVIANHIFVAELLDGATSAVLVDDFVFEDDAERLLASVPAGLGVDVVNALSTLVQARTYASAERTAESHVVWRPARQHHDVAAQQFGSALEELAHKGYRSIRVATAARYWSVGNLPRGHCLAVDTDAGRIQLLPEDADWREAA
jgi:hypothetical protein